MPDLVYEAIEQLERNEVAAAVKRNNPLELSTVVLSVALYDNDRAFAESFCKKYARHEDSNVRGNAILGFSHIARIHGKLDEGSIKPVIAAALLDENNFVRGQAESAQEDTAWYLSWKY